MSNKEYWWEHEIGDSPPVHDNLIPHVQQIEERQYAIHRQHLFHAKMYSNRELMTLKWGSHNENSTNYSPVSYRNENIVASVVDTVRARIGRARTKPTPVVKDADWSVETLAKQLDKYIYGEFQRLDIYKLGMHVFTDACWATIGALKIDIDDGDIYAERVMPDEIIVDQRESLSGELPQTMYHRKLVSRHQLRAMFPEHRQEIEDAQAKDWHYTSYRTPTTDMVVVVEGWMRPFGDMPGRRALCIDGFTLEYEEYDRDVFPFVFLRWQDLPGGFYGKSLVEEIAPFQIRMNEINRVIRMAQDLMAVPRIFVDGSSKIIKTQLDNEIARVIHYRGKMPEVMNWQAVTDELYAERERTRNAAMEYPGVSQLSAQARLPDQVRLDSSKAIREVSNTEDSRFTPKLQKLEKFYLEIGEHILELSAMLYKDGENKRVKYHERNLIDEIEWSDVKSLIDDKQYVLQVESSSVVNMSPAAREDQLNEWAIRGLITPDRHKALLDNRDLEEELSLQAAGINNIKWVIEQLDRGEFPTPDPLMNLIVGIPYVHQTYLVRVQKDAPEEILQAYRDWITQAEYTLSSQAQPQQQAALQTPTGPEGTVQPAVATTAQGVPTQLG